MPDNAQIRLSANDSIVLLTSRGTRTFRGPGTFRPTQAGAQVAGNSGARVGAVRSAGIDPSVPQPSIWQIDVSSSGTVCLTSASAATLWRPDTSGAARLSIRGPGGSTHEVNWPAGQATLAWPSAVPLANDGDYQLTQPGSPVPTSVRVKLVGQVSTDFQAIAETLIRNGCQQQLDVLVDSLPGL
ncbi:MAG: hypothetical protein AB7O91_01195 [Sphingomonas sp.]